MSRIAAWLLFLATVAAFCLAAFFSDDRWGSVGAILLVSAVIAFIASVFAS